MDKDLEKAYDDYAKDDDIKITQVVTDYAELMRELLNRIQDEVEAKELDNLINLVKTAQDYLFYLEDNRRVIL
jgi:TRAP-type C4-dicarboxylate transport system substrate-binding protein